MLFLLDAVFFLFEFHAVAKQSSHINICVSTASCDSSPTMFRSQVHLLRQLGTALASLLISNASSLKEIAIQSG